MTTRAQIEAAAKAAGAEYPEGTRLGMPDGGIMMVTHALIGSTGERLRTLTVDGKSMTVTVEQITAKIAAGVIRIH